MYYINYKPTELSKWAEVTREEIKAKRKLTIESHETHRQAQTALDDLRYFDPFGTYWISTRACKNWTKETE